MIETVEAQTARVQGSKHVPELQSFRGIAALIVLVAHCSFYYAIPLNIRHLSAVLLNAHAAVVSFFVLSGYVLRLSLGTARPSLRSATAFYVRRAFRIYPALFFASALGLLYLVAFHHQVLPSITSDWWDGTTMLSKPIEVLPVLAAFLALTPALPLPIWTLFIEIIGSVLMPLIVFITNFGKWSSLLLIAALAVVSKFYGPHSPQQFGIYIVGFAWGASIFQFKDFFQFLTSTTLRTRMFGLAAFLGLLLIRQMGGKAVEVNYHSVSAANFEAFFAAILVGIIAARPNAFGLLSAKSAIWIGDVSYSVYLVHMPIMALIAAFCANVLHLSLFTANPWIATFALIAATLLVTLPLSSLSYRFIELPMLKMGKRVSKSMAKERAMAAAA